MEGKLYLFCGDDEYLVASAAQECVHRLIPESEKEWGLEIIDGQVDTADEISRAISQCIESVCTPNFFGSMKVTWLRNATFFAGTGRIVESQTVKTAIDKMTTWLQEGLLSEQILVISAAKVLRTTSFFKTCKKLGELKDFGSAAKGWQREKLAAENLTTFFEQAQLQATPSIRTEFLQRVGFDSRTLISEIEKLRTYIAPRTAVNLDDIRAITAHTREAEAWDILDAVGMRDAKKTVATINNLSSKKGITIMLATILEKYLRDLLILREAYERNWLTAAGWRENLTPAVDAIIADLPGTPRKMNNWLLRRRLEQARNFTIVELEHAHQRIVDLREKLVSTALPEFFLLETTLLKIIGHKATRPSVASRAP